MAVYRVFEALDELGAIVEEARGVPMTAGCVVPRGDVLELIDADDYVITATVLHAVPRGQESASGAGVSDTYVFVHKLRDGLVVEGWEYRTKQEALEAVGWQPRQCSCGGFRRWS